MKKQFTPQDVWKFSYLSWPALSADGQYTAVTVKKPDTGGVCQPRVRVLEARMGRVVYESPAGVREMQPRFTQDGRLYLLSDASGAYQVWQISLENGERIQKTSLRHGVNHYDARMGVIAFEATLWPEEIDDGTAFHEMTAEEKSAWEKELDSRPYVAEDLTYKMDEWFGMRKGEKPVIGLCDAKGQRLLTQFKDTEGVYPALSPDGEALAFFAYPHGGVKGRTAELMICRDDGKPAAQLTGDVMYTPSQAPVFSPDGKSVWALAYQQYENGYSQTAVRLDVATGKLAFVPDLTEETVCEGVNEMVAGRTENGENQSCLAVLANKLLFLGGFQGKTRLYAVSLDTPKKIEIYNDAFEDITGFCVNGRGDAAVLAGSFAAPADLYVNGKQLTDEHAWLSEYEMPITEEIHIPSRDGQAELRYFFTHPIGVEGPAPVVLDIKGGPDTMYAHAYWHEFHALAAAGFGVIHGNPRGSAGFGRAFCAGGVCWKDEPMNDLIDMCLDAIQRGWADEKRLGVTGGSYGGYMTLKLIGKTKYFAAAAGQRVFANPGTSYGTGDVGWVSAEGEVPPHFSMLQYLTDRARGSNVSRVDQIDTPLLLLHGYKDYRCTFEQAEQMFIAMKERRPQVPLRLVMFPKENHALTRTGNMNSQVRHLQEIVDWMGLYLKGKKEQHE
ncbi:MAG: S9 family peptidase [Clostridia bacterium]|nr:S9 family peptidase [Clostridia bacterium]